MSASVEAWGKDHWSTFAYVETVCVDGGGVLAPIKMRVDGDRYPTRLKEGELPGHSDWDCLRDMEDAGLVNIIFFAGGAVKMTGLGKLVAAELRAHKADGKNFHAFNPSRRLLAQIEAARIGAGVRT